MVLVGFPQFGQNMSPCPSWVPQYLHEGKLALLRNIRAVKSMSEVKGGYVTQCPVYVHLFLYRIVKEMKTDLRVLRLSLLVIACCESRLLS